MANADGSNRLADEAQPLLRTHSSGGSSIRGLVWFERRLSAYQLARAALQPININVLLVFFPLGLAAAAFNRSSILTSVFNFLAIIPLSATVSNISDELSDELGDLWGGLINATFGNAVELIVGILAVIHRDTAFAQSVMIGSILSDTLFVLGVCFFSAAWRKSILQLNTAMADALSSLMIITAVALILPTALYSTFESSMPLDLKDQILAFSRGTAVVLFVLYIAYIYFELGSHKHLFDPPPDESTAQDYGNVTVQQETRQGTRQDTQQGTEQDTQQNVQQDVQQDMQQDTPPPSTLLTSVTVLFCSGAGIMLCSHFLLDSIDETSKVTHISKTFIATILIPIASNAPECATVVGASRRGKIDFAVGVIVSSILQIALCVIPVLVMLGWVIHQPMTLNFDTFQTIMLFLAILLVNHLLQNGKYTYMHGLVLVGLYAVLVVAFYLRHDI